MTGKKPADSRANRIRVTQGDRMRRSTIGLLNLLDSRNERVQVQAAKALEESDETVLDDALVELLAAAESQIVRKWAAYILGFRANEGATQPLAAALRDRSNELDTRCHAAEAIGHLGILYDPGADARAALHEALDEEPADIRFWAAFALSNVGTDEDIPHLRPLAESDHRVVERWWSVSKEAQDAIDCILDPERCVIIPGESGGTDSSG